MNSFGRRKSICFLTNTYPENEESYRGIFVKTLAERLVRRGYEISVITPRIFKESALWEDGEGRPFVSRFPFWSEDRLLITYEHIPWLRMASYFLSGLYYARKNIMSHQCSLIHAHWVIPTGFMGVLLGKGLGIPVVVHARGSDIHTFSRRSPWVYRLTQFTLNSADVILTVSDQLKQTLIEEFRISADRIHLSMNGVDFSIFRPLGRVAQRRKLNLPPRGKIVLFVGGLVAVKGLHYLIKAVEILSGMHPNRFLVVIVGEGIEDKPLREMARKSGVERLVRFVGRVPHDEVSVWMNAADALILPSLEEGMPNTVLEAQACGLPVVVTRVGGSVDLIEDGVDGLLIEPANSESIAEKLTLLFTERGLYQRLRSNARIKNAAYSTEWQTTALEEVYARVWKGQSEQVPSAVEMNRFP